MNDWLIGLEAVLAWQPLFFMVLGVIAGIAVGAIPGLTATMAIAVVLPFTFAMDPLPGIMMLLGLYSSAVYAGSIPAILMRLPGTPASAATALDGYALTQRGRGGQALMISLVATFVGALIGGIGLALFAPYLAGVAVNLGAAEYAMIAFFAIAIIGAMSEGALAKGLISGVLGLLIATVGIDPIDGYARFTFGSSDVRSGLDFIPILIGIFGVAEAFRQFEKRAGMARLGSSTALGKYSIRGVWRKLVPGVPYSSMLGFGVGVLPGTGGDIGAFIGHNEVRRISRDNSKFGKGDPRGLAAAESANNAAVPGTIAPTIVLGIPGNSAAAVLIGAITVHGLRPGPQLFEGSPDLVYGIFWSLLFIPFIMLIIGLAGIQFWGRIVSIPRQYLWPSVLALSVIGSYALRGSVFDVMVMTCAGVLGYAMHKGGFPVAPLIIGLIVGPIAEANFRRATILSGGGYSWMLEPLPLVFLVLGAATLAFPIIKAWRKRNIESL